MIIVLSLVLLLSLCIQMYHEKRIQEHESIVRSIMKILREKFNDKEKEEGIPVLTAGGIDSSSNIQITEYNPAKGMPKNKIYLNDHYLEFTPMKLGPKKKTKKNKKKTSNK